MEQEIEIACHHDSPMLTGAIQIHWRQEERGEIDEWGYTRDRCWRTCSYCGSMHPADLLKFLIEGAKLESADWKYGWPHKFYVHGMKNPIAGRAIKLGSKSGGGEAEEDI